MGALEAYRNAEKENPKLVGVIPVPHGQQHDPLKRGPKEPPKQRVNHVSVGDTELLIKSKTNSSLHGADLAEFKREEANALAAYEVDGQVELEVVEIDDNNPDQLSGFAVSALVAVKKNMPNAIAEKGLRVAAPEVVLENRLAVEELGSTGLRLVGEETISGPTPQNLVVLEKPPAEPMQQLAQAA